jgi:pyridoxamine 5'-phosphate oxidase
MTTPQTATTPALVPPVPPFYNDLEATLRHAWAQLDAATTDRRSGFHALTVASVGLDGTPQQRSMILRKVDSAARTLRFNADIRSVKCEELRLNPAISALGYSIPDKLQLRLNGMARIDQHSALADYVWTTMRDQSRVAYAQPSAPGDVLTQPDGYEPPIELRLDEPAATLARENFCLVHLDIQRLDWVFLNIHGNRRAQFSWPEGALNARWLAP